jgi:mevalonate kinase
MHGSNALAIPFRKYTGKWAWNSRGSVLIDFLMNFCNYLEDNQGYALFIMDISQFRKDIASGLYFDSAIPMGYGIGSSGALCAAFYGKYVVNAIQPDCDDYQMIDLKKHLSFLESYFHGSSSGIDPMVSYTNSTILVEASGKVKRLSHHSFHWEQVSLFLIDTQIKGTTIVNIQLFKNLMMSDVFSFELKENYNSLVNQSINFYLNGNALDFMTLVRLLSNKQQSLFEPMIPPEFLKYFQMARETSRFFLKLCGSGGGGFLLGFTTDIEYVEQLFQAGHVNIIRLEQHVKIMKD